MSTPKRYHYRGRLLTLKQIAERTGVSPKTLGARIRRGMTPEEAAHGRMRRKPMICELDGVTYTVQELAKMSGVAVTTIRWRLENGATVEEAIRKESRAKLYPYHGREITIREAAGIAGVSADALKARMRKYGIAMEDAVDGRYEAAKYHYGDANATAEEIAAAEGIPVKRLKYYLSAGKRGVEEALRLCRAEAGMDADGARGECTPAAASERMVAARLIGGVISGTVPLKPLEGGGWYYDGGVCLYAVRFPESGRAVLEVYHRRSKGVMMRRKYEYDAKGVWEAGA